MKQVILEVSLVSELGAFLAIRKFTMAVKLVVFPIARILHLNTGIIDKAFSMSF